MFILLLLLLLLLLVLLLFQGFKIFICLLVANYRQQLC